MTTPSTPRTAAAAQGRKADSARRRGRVIKALNQAATDGTELSVAGIARAAGVDRSFLYRHRDLLEQLHAAEAQPRLFVRASSGPTRGASSGSIRDRVAASSGPAGRWFVRRWGDGAVR